MDKTTRLFNSIVAEAVDLRNVACEMEMFYEDALAAYDALSDKQMWNLSANNDENVDYIVQCFEYNLIDSVEDLRDATSYLKSFDDSLARLLTLRAKLGEEIGIPFKAK
jgi:hypothetical protein